MRGAAGEALDDHVGGCGSKLQRESDPHHRVPLVLDHVEIHRLAQEGSEFAAGIMPLGPIELLALEVLDPWQEGEAEQVAQGEEDLGVAVRVGRVVPDSQDRVVVGQGSEARSYRDLR